MKIRDVIKKIEEKYPIYIKEKWDNVGFLVGNKESEITKVIVTLDVTMDVIDEAIEKGANLIISHHPFIFDSIKNVTASTILGNKIIKLIKHDISVYSMHTNLDMADDGLNDYLAQKLELVDVEKLNPDKFEDAYMRVGNLKYEMTLKEFANFIKQKLMLEHIILVSQDESKNVKKIAICSGSGKSFIKDSMKMKVDCYVTGDINYHTALDALEDDFNIIDAGHFGTEKIVTELLAKYLQENIEVEIIKTEKMINPLKIY